MSHEILTTPERQIETVEQIVRQHPEVAGFQAYEDFRNNATAQKDAFIAGQDLELTYPELTVESLNEVAVPAKQALESLMPGKGSPKSRALRDAIEYRYSEMFMVATAERMHDKSLTPAERSEAADWFKLANESLYGTPEKTIFSSLAKQHIIPQLEKQVSPELSITTTLQTELRTLLGEIDATDFQTFKASQEIVNQIHDLVHERFAYLVDHIDPDKTYATTEMQDVLSTALHKLGGNELGWKVAIVPDSNALAVSAHQKLVEVGENRPDIKGEVLQGKVLHEIGVHANRAINAEKAGWLSAQYGQDGYLDFEEALATAFEDAYAGKFADHGVPYYLVAGLAYGLDNHEPRDMRDVHEIMWRYNALKAQKGEEDLTPEHLTKTKETTFNTCMRLFRGTDTQTPGLIYFKDVSYFRGQELAWSVLNDVHTQADMDILFAGKLDLTRPDHKEIAQQIQNTLNT